VKIGIIGGGQLGRMLALAAYPLGVEVRCFDPSPEAPAGIVADLVTGEYDDHAALERFLHGVDLVTYEFENVPVQSIRFVEQFVPVYPHVRALEVGQDRFHEKEFFRALGIPTPAYCQVDSFPDLRKAIESTGLPAVLKTRRLGYDGKGQARITRMEDAEIAWDDIGHQPAILEEFIPFERELSVVAVRNRSNAILCYPLIENVHRNGILSVSRAPFNDTALQETATVYAHKILSDLDYTGVFALELFHKGGTLLANEMAPRVHNSGHWTIEGAVSSQFENHIRAIANFPLGSTAPVGHSAMVNIIGGLPPVEQLLKLSAVHLHLYGKSARPLRKIGHVTINAATASIVEQQFAAVRKIIGV
jgi:5-(carboxyamino)imidazole ribonucleotide synthase